MLHNVNMYITLNANFDSNSFCSSLIVGKHILKSCKSKLNDLMIVAKMNDLKCNRSLTMHRNDAGVLNQPAQQKSLMTLQHQYLQPVENHP